MEKVDCAKTLLLCVPNGIARRPPRRIRVLISYFELPASVFKSRNSRWKACW